MRKTFTQLTPNFSVKKAWHIACPSVVCTTNDIKNNSKDDLANAGSFSFIKGSRQCGELSGQPISTTSTNSNVAFVKTLLRKSGVLAIALLVANLFFVKESFATFIATWSNPNLGTTNWCAGETRTISITVKNAGTNTWIFNGANPVRIGATWDGDVGYPYRTYMTANVSPSNTVTLSILVTAPSTFGTHVLHIDMVQEGICWFAGFGSGACNPGTSRYDSPPVTINSLPTASAIKTDINCFNAGNGTITITGGGGSGSYKYSISNGLPLPLPNGYQVSSIFNGLAPGQYKIRVIDSNGCESRSVQ